MRLFWIGLLAGLVACASPARAPVDIEPPETAEITYLPPLAEVTLVTAAGMREPRPEESDTARLNLAEALSGTVPEELFYPSRNATDRAQLLSQHLGTLDPESVALAEPTDQLLALIRVRYDFESSASRLVQGSLDIMFGGVPGPDGIEQSAELLLVNSKTNELVWYCQIDARDPRKTEEAQRLINELIARTFPPAET